MTAWAFCLCFNEAEIIHYWVRHYRSFCERVIVYVDSETSDDTAVLAHREGAEVRVFGSLGSLDDVAFIEFARKHYREARGQADWVIWADADEFVYHPRIADRLVELRTAGVTYPHVVGYGMMSDHLPTTTGQIYDELRCGILAPAYSKVCVFDPYLEVAWTTGKHKAQLSGHVQRDDGQDPIKLLHYRWLGEDYFQARSQRNYDRLNKANRDAKHGIETYPDYEGPYSLKWYKEQLTTARECI